MQRRAISYAFQGSSRPDSFSHAFFKSISDNLLLFEILRFSQHSFGLSIRLQASQNFPISPIRQRMSPLEIQRTDPSHIYRKSLENQLIIISQESKKMNFSFDIQPVPQQDQISHGSLIEIAPADQKESILPVIKCKKSRARQSNFAWTKTEEKKYIVFLRNNEELFSLTAKERKDIKINVLVSGAVRSRTPAQCHSHHQKMMLKYGNIQNIIAGITEYILSKTRGEIHGRKEEKLENIEEKAPSEGTIQAQRSLQLNSPEEQPQAQPAWWQYLTLIDDRLQQESFSLPWHYQPFFF